MHFVYKLDILFRSIRVYDEIKLICYKGISFFLTYYNSRLFVHSVCTIQLLGGRSSLVPVPTARREELFSTGSWRTFSTGSCHERVLMRLCQVRLGPHEHL